MIFYALLSHFYANFSGFVQRSQFVYDINGSETTGGIKIVGIDEIIPLIEA